MSWQVVQSTLLRMPGDADATRVHRVTEAMQRMKNLEIAALQRAWNG